MSFRVFLFFFTDTATTEIYTLSLHDALPILVRALAVASVRSSRWRGSCAPDAQRRLRSEEHTSELQSQSNLVCRLLLEKKKKTDRTSRRYSSIVDRRGCDIRAIYPFWF